MLPDVLLVSIGHVLDFYELIVKYREYQGCLVQEDEGNRHEQYHDFENVFDEIQFHLVVEQVVHQWRQYSQSRGLRIALQLLKGQQTHVLHRPHHQAPVQQRLHYGTTRSQEHNQSYVYAFFFKKVENDILIPLPGIGHDNREEAGEQDERPAVRHVQRVGHEVKQVKQPSLEEKLPLGAE